MDYVFIKEGYSFFAGLFGPYWSLANKMWVEAAAHIGAMIILSIIMDMIGFNAEAISSTMMISNIIFGLFARDLQRFHYDRRGYDMVSVVNGKSYLECETSFFHNRLKQAQAS